ncbi:hypothetical protein HYALB_00010178 [Hymenoscyphus albidus]|uniref:Uncharacterized protein n=1 Tax=Hymenoscyphus albidus TaxID=595503 RepID=A0A9N9LCC2_9HELO|nr:hypothetical protein HYALB_00010178 [Hymenoscyphus albidus]
MQIAAILTTMGYLATTASAATIYTNAGWSFPPGGAAEACTKSVYCGNTIQSASGGPFQTPRTDCDLIAAAGAPTGYFNCRPDKNFPNGKIYCCT